MQKSTDQHVNANDITRISQGASIKGDLVSSTDIRVDGRIDGKVLSDGKVVVGETAKLSGCLMCKNLDFWGKMDGDIFVKDTLSLKSQAVINGNLHVRKLQVELGAQINGSCKMITEQEYDENAGKSKVGAPAPAKAKA